jgi:multidrug efflux pump subunit AcrA (membrane-fusion protein)
MLHIPLPRRMHFQQLRRGARMGAIYKGENAMSLSVECPKDGFIKRIAFRSGDVVNAGSVICEIEPDDENHAIARVNLAQKLLDLEAELLAPVNVTLRRSILQNGLDVASTNADYCQTQLDQVSAQFYVGQTDRLAVKNAETALARAKADKNKVQASLDLFDFNIRQANSRLDLYRTQINNELTFIESKAARLQIKAPVDGKVSYLVAADSFIMKGHALASIG